MIPSSDLFRGPFRTFGLTVTSIFPYNVKMCVVVIIVNKMYAYSANLFSVFQRFTVQHNSLFIGETKSIVLNNESYMFRLKRPSSLHSVKIHGSILLKICFEQEKQL